MVSEGTDVPSDCRRQWAWPILFIPRHSRGFKGGGAELRMAPTYETLVAGGWMGVVETKLKCVVFNKCCWRKEGGGVAAWQNSSPLGAGARGVEESLSLVSGCLGWRHRLHLRFSFCGVGLVVIVTSPFVWKTEWEVSVHVKHITQDWTQWMSGIIVTILELRAFDC